MPIEAIIIDTTIEATGARKTNWGNIAIVGLDAGGDAVDETVYELTNLADVGTKFGTTGDIYKAAERIFDHKVEKVYCIRATNTSVVDESVSQGSLQTLTNSPVSLRTAPDVDEGAITLNFVYGTPTAPSSGEANLNTKTGEIWIDGAGSSSVDYWYADTWDDVWNALKDYDVDIVLMANHPASEAAYGDLDAAKTAVDANDWLMIIMSEDDTTADDFVLDMANYESRNIAGFAHKDATNDVAAAISGVLAVEEPWHKLMWKTIKNISPAGYFTKTEVETTLEGGSTPCNAVIKKGDYNLCSDGLTTGAGDYKFIDITRTRYYLEDLLIAGLDALIQGSEVPYTDAGIEMVRSAIESALETAVVLGALKTPFVNADGDVQRGYLVEVPTYASIPAADKTNRLLQNVFVTCWLTGHIQTIKLNLAIQL